MFKEITKKLCVTKKSVKDISRSGDTYLQLQYSVAKAREPYEVEYNLVYKVNSRLT